jgi:hypothetical protein
VVLHQKLCWSPQLTCRLALYYLDVWLYLQLLLLIEIHMIFFVWNHVGSLLGYYIFQCCIMCLKIICSIILQVTDVNETGL